MPTSPSCLRQTRDVPFSPNSITPTSPPRKFRGSRRNGIWAKGDVTGLSQTCSGRHGEVSILQFGFTEANVVAEHFTSKQSFLTSNQQHQRTSHLVPLHYPISNRDNVLSNVKWTDVDISTRNNTWNTHSTKIHQYLPDTSEVCRRAQETAICQMHRTSRNSVTIW